MKPTLEIQGESYYSLSNLFQRLNATGNSESIVLGRFMYTFKWYDYLFMAFILISIFMFTRYLMNKKFKQVKFLNQSYFQIITTSLIGLLFISSIYSVVYYVTGNQTIQNEKGSYVQTLNKVYDFKDKEMVSKILISKDLKKMYFPPQEIYRAEQVNTSEGKRTKIHFNKKDKLSAYVSTDVYEPIKKKTIRSVGVVFAYDSKAMAFKPRDFYFFDRFGYLENEEVM